jgi:large subunit ribosomal protein L23
MAEWKSLEYPHLTEKSVTLIESANTVVFVVKLKAKKPDIKKEFEEVFEVKVARVNTEVTPDGKKKAYIKLKPEFKASDVAVKLGVV